MRYNTSSPQTYMKARKHVLTAWDDGSNKIQAIKALRTVAPMSLKEAKDFMDAMPKDLDLWMQESSFDSLWDSAGCTIDQEWVDSNVADEPLVGVIVPPTPGCDPRPGADHVHAGDDGDDAERNQPTVG